MSAATATSPVLERRRERRVSVKLPIMVRGIDRSGASFEQRTTTENVCRGGVAFVVRHPVSLGGQVKIEIPDAPVLGASSKGESSTEFSTHGRIVHLVPGKDGQDSVVGVEFTGPHFHRIFVSESTS